MSLNVNNNNFNFNPFGGAAGAGNAAGAPKQPSSKDVARQEMIMGFLQRAEAAYFGDNPMNRVKTAGKMLDNFSANLNPRMTPDQVKGQVNQFIKGNMSHLFSMYQASHDSVFEAWMMKGMWDNMMKGTSGAGMFTDSITGLSNKMAMQQSIAKAASQMMAPLTGGALNGGRIFG